MFALIGFCARTLTDTQRYRQGNIQAIQCLSSLGGCGAAFGVRAPRLSQQEHHGFEEDEIAIIDFQDAIVGPVTYDPVSLLKDVYIVWPRARQMVWLDQYWKLLIETGRLPDGSWTDFMRWYDLMGLQRHVKILGVFSRLWLRDHKPDYMRDIPVVIEYIRELVSFIAMTTRPLLIFGSGLRGRSSQPQCKPIGMKPHETRDDLGRRRGQKDAASHS